MLTIAIDWQQIASVVGSLLISPVLGFGLAFAFYKVLAMTVSDRRVFEAPPGDRPPPPWMRSLLLLTCTGVSFSHGTNDGQKSIGLIMLTVIGLMPATYDLNRSMSEAQVHEIADRMPLAVDLIGRGGDSRKQRGIDGANALRRRFANLNSPTDIPDAERSSVRNDVNQVLAALRAAESSHELPKADRAKAKAIHDEIMRSVEYAPLWGAHLERALPGRRYHDRLSQDREDSW